MFEVFQGCFQWLSLFVLKQYISHWLSYFIWGFTTHPAAFSSSSPICSGFAEKWVKKGEEQQEEGTSRLRIIQEATNSGS